ncbi:HesA/MoeB/ThiF family protein [Robiginitomaculum antarcticum]|uniref:HesA/MoeB/ThiF family protein n=1 Tax=Robiginitomaculum antarcticum TaxID=437507 RepID=UPI000364047A|nr:molybdopterin-synthase adenylyltransferase MoeB [Robiginitomaculum antarcticum]
MTPEQISRYARHLVLKEIGGPGQAKLLAANIAIIGAGGLGGPAGLYLAAAGVGKITIIDDDAVDITNLQRQIQFVQTDIGALKTEAMGGALVDLNPDITVRREQMRLTDDNAADLLRGHDLILDGTDSFQTRFIVNDASLYLGIPLISGALGRFDGQISVFSGNGADGPCYRCLVPSIPPDAQTCAQVGVVGALAGIIGAQMALEAVKMITGAGAPLIGKLYLFDGLAATARTVTLPKDPACPACGAK